MDEQIRQALATNQTIEITTIGRSSGQPRRIETALFVIDHRPYLSGFPGKRDWYANLLANPAFTLHLKQSVVADLPAVATPITDHAARQAVMKPLLLRINRSSEIDAWVAASPLVAISVDGANGSA